MKLFGKILITSLLPLFISLAVIVILMTGSIRNELAGVDRNDELRLGLVESRLDGILEDLTVTSTILATSKDSARAVRFAESDFLYDWSRLFHGRNISKIIFTDLDGIVLSRSDDEFLFGDDLSGNPAVKKALSGMGTQGLFEIDGNPCFVSGKRVLLYGDIPAGAILACAAVTPELLANAAAGTGIGLTMELGQGITISSTKSGDIRKQVPILIQLDPEGMPLSNLHADFPEEQSVTRLKTLRRNFIVISLSAGILLLTGIFVLLRLYLKPYTLLVGGLLRLSDNKTDFSGLRREFEERFSDPNHEVTVISKAVSMLTITLEENFRTLEKLSTTDKLTGLYNRLYLEKSLEREADRANRYATCFSVLLLDIDHFKNVNDTYGHAMGDEVLKRIAAAIRGGLRSTDIAGRWGGEEFVVVCPAINLEGGLALGEKVRQDIQEMESPTGKSITASIGAAVYTAGESVLSLMARVDEALYKAKSGGRNRVEFVS